MFPILSMYFLLLMLLVSVDISPRSNRLSISYLIRRPSSAEGLNRTEYWKGRMGIFWPYTAPI